MCRKPLGMIFCVLSLVGLAFAESNSTDQITITTYYPSPYGVYKNVRLHPSRQPQAGVEAAGLVYYNMTQNVMKYYNGTRWVNLTGTECQRKRFREGEDDRCDTGYFTWSAVASSADGWMLCCKVNNP